MPDITDRRREPKGIPTGGRFAHGNGGGRDASDLGAAVPWTMPPLPPRPQGASAMPPLPPRVKTDYADPFDDYDGQEGDTARANWLASHLRRGDPGSVDLAVHAIVHHDGRLSDAMVDAIQGSGCIRRGDGSVDADGARRVAHALETKMDPTVGQERVMVGWYEPGAPGERQAASVVLGETRDPDTAEAALATVAIADGSADRWYARLLRNASYPRDRTAGQARRAMMAAAPIAYGLVPDGEAERRIDGIVDGMVRRGLVRR